MDRIALIEQVACRDGNDETRALVNALVRCLEPAEVAALLLRSISAPAMLRAAVIRKVRSDIETGRLSDATPLIDELSGAIANGEPRRRESVAYCLLQIALACPPKQQRRIQAFLGASDYIGLRRRSYKIYDTKSVKSRALLEEAWRQNLDYEAGWLIVKTFPVEFLLAEKATLLQILTEGWQLSRFYLRISEAFPDELAELLERDPISYVYVAARLRIQLRVKLVREVLDSSEGDSRLGLLLWSIGELGLWDVLVSYVPQVETDNRLPRA
ncbi:hypothetical protein [Paraburkholderia nemoris]|uniref:HEAT repeat domain-containing protein n=1 Tax=Paraburkholderia nemoris TaxID=2793076 RepID=A0ABN7L074_9BURK|nr:MULTISPECIES: hypothetical protein [Paraburkholderia]MBK3810117.1 hypothetical protein [Paraburkholderia aspalathi]CAE6724209.1 hypothetical protein R69776_01678 [Paraburkholderia nemoris]CAE6748924.1 hypothetical protein R75777_02892 [Paraburkholderia nemoris]